MRRDDTESRMVHSFLAAGRRYKKNIFPRTWLDDCAELPFEDGVFPVSTHYDALLTRLYGDYRTLPAPEERKCKEHVAIFDLDSSYERTEGDAFCNTHQEYSIKQGESFLWKTIHREFL